MDGGAALSSVLRALLSLVGVSALAWVVLALIARRSGARAALGPDALARGFGAWGVGLGFGRRGQPPRLRVVERVSLSARRQLYLVQADSRTFLVGAAEAGPLSLIAELEPAPAIARAVEAPAAPRAPSREVLD